MDEAAVPAADDHFGPAAHGGMHGVVGQADAIDAVVRVGRHAADGVAGVDVLEVHLHADRREMIRRCAASRTAPMSLSRALPEASVSPPACFHQILAGALGHDDDGVAPRSMPLSQDVQKPALAFELERHFGDRARSWRRSWPARRSRR